MSAFRDGCVPDVGGLQSWIEQAWNKGRNVRGYLVHYSIRSVIFAVVLSTHYSFNIVGLKYRV